MTARLAREPAREFRDPTRLWDDAAIYPVKFGCKACVDFNICGGAHNKAAMFDCNDLCTCPDKSTCDAVCRNHPERFAARVREVNGFDLATVPRSAPVSVPTLPTYVPLIDHKYRRSLVIREPAVAVSLYHLVNLRKGTPNVLTREDLQARFLIPKDALLVVSGVGKDAAVERWWEIAPKADIFNALAQLNIGIVTSPNFSLFTDHPRTDNFHAMKRILIAWDQFAAAGIPCALHVNARTEQDYERWVREINRREEISVISFEFGTGAGWAGRIPWHIAQLRGLAARVNRPLTLILRGGGPRLDEFRDHYARVVLIDSHAFSRTLRRQKAVMNEDGDVSWLPFPTERDAPLDQLLANNITTARQQYLGNRPAKPLPVKQVRRQRRIATSRDDQAVEPWLLSQINASFRGGTFADNGQGIVSTPESELALVSR